MSPVQQPDGQLGGMHIGSAARGRRLSESAVAVRELSSRVGQVLWAFLVGIAMNQWTSVYSDLVGSCGYRVQRYISHHLQSPKEAGCLALLPPFRDQSGLIHPHFHNLALWHQVGHSIGVGQPEPKLVVNLCMGMDASGNQLTKTALFTGPLEVVITLPSELSHALWHNPQAAYPTLLVAASTLVEGIERFAVNIRVGGRQNEPRPAQTLTIAWFHARNKSGEPHFHAHVLIFSPAMYEPGLWHVLQTARFMEELHRPGGTRERSNQAAIEEVTKHGYNVEQIKGKANPDQLHGARVTCPDGTVIHPGSIPRRRGAEVHARQAVWWALGAPMLTSAELPLVLQQYGQFPSAAAGGLRQEKFVKKLGSLQLLDAEGRITQDLLPALSRLDESLAKVEVSLRDLPFQEARLASQKVREHREELRDQVPEISTNDWIAQHAWTTEYDEILELVATGAYDWTALTPEKQNTMYLLDRAGVLKKHWGSNWPVFRLSKKGEARRQLGLQEAEEIKAVVPKLLAYASAGQVAPEVILGRLRLAGVHVHDTELQFRRIGRAVEAGEQIREAGIDASMPFIPDLDWWQWYWDHREELPGILAKVILRPEELPSNWPGGRQGKPRPARVSPPPIGGDEPRYDLPLHTGHRRRSHPQFQDRGSRASNNNPAPRAPQTGNGHDRRR